MSASRPSDPRVHALRTLASLLVRHGPTPPLPEPTERVDSPEAVERPAPANATEPVRKAA